MPIKQKLIQLVLEGLIPLLGFFLWDWSLYFILLFYFIDLAASEFIMHLKSRKTIRYKNHIGEKKRWLKWGIISSVLFLFSLFVIHLAMFFIVPGIQFCTEVYDFINYEEMGIKQGYILIPLVLLLSYQQYKMTFLMPARFRNTDIQSLWKGHIIATIAIIAFAGLSLGIAQFVLFPEIIYVLGIVFFSSLFALRFKN